MKVYRACDGIQTFDDLKRKYRFTDDLIYLALDELQKNDLLDGYQSTHFSGLSRREVVRRVGLASMIACRRVRLVRLSFARQALAVALQQSTAQLSPEEFATATETVRSILMVLIARIRVPSARLDTAVLTPADCIIRRFVRRSRLRPRALYIVTVSAGSFPVLLTKFPAPLLFGTRAHKRHIGRSS